MRRSIIIALVVAVLTVGLGAFSEGRIHHLSEEYQRQLAEVGEALDRSDWLHAQAQVLALFAQWEEGIDGVQLWVNHEDTDSITRALHGLLASLTAKDALSSLLYYGECMENFAHLYHRDAFTWKNIL